MCKYTLLEKYDRNLEIWKNMILILHLRRNSFPFTYSNHVLLVQEAKWESRFEDLVMISSFKVLEEMLMI